MNELKILSAIEDGARGYIIQDGDRKSGFIPISDDIRDMIKLVYGEGYLAALDAARNIIKNC